MRARGQSRRLRRTVHVTAVLLAAMCAVLTAAYAATGHLPLRGLGGPDGAPHAMATSLRGPVQLAGDASVLFDVANLTPGTVKVAEIRIANTGTFPGDFTVTPQGLQDQPAGLPEPLSTVLDLTVQDATLNRFAPTTIYQGKLAAFSALALGRTQPGASKLYRFTVRFPTGRTDAQDNPLQGAVTTVVFAWDAVFDESVVPTVQPPTTPPATPAVTTPKPPAPTPQPPAPTTEPAAPAAQPAAGVPASLSVSWRRQRLGGGLLARVRCLQACRGRVRGTVGLGSASRAVALKATRVRLGAGRSRTYVLRIPKRRARAVSAALRRGRKVVGRATLEVTTPSGKHRVTSVAALRAKR